MDIQISKKDIKKFLKENIILGCKPLMILLGLLIIFCFYCLYYWTLKGREFYEYWFVLSISAIALFTIILIIKITKIKKKFNKRFAKILNNDYVENIKVSRSNDKFIIDNLTLNSENVLLEKDIVNKYVKNNILILIDRYKKIYFFPINEEMFQLFNIQKNDKINKTLIDLLATTIFLLPFIGMIICIILGEIDVFDIYGIIRYSWIMYIVTAIGGVIAIISKIFTKNNNKFNVCYIASIFTIVLSMITGSFRFAFSNINYDVNEIRNIEQKMNMTLSNDIKVINDHRDNITFSYVKITNEKSKIKFEDSIKNNFYWLDELITNNDDNYIFQLYNAKIQNYDKFIIYNVTKNEYNNFLNNEDNEYIFIAYRYEKSNFIILSDYKINNDSLSI